MKPRRIIWGSTLVKPESWSVNCPCSTCTTSRDLKNQQADALARIASLVEGLTPRTIICEVLDQPSINSLQVHTINRTHMDRGNNWLPERQITPLRRKGGWNLKKNVGWFICHEGHLYKKTYTHPLLKYVTPFEGNYILREIHEWASSSHQGAKIVVRRL